MELGVYRKFKNPLYTIGKFSIDGISICDTLEPPVRNLNDYNHDGDFDDKGEGKVYGNTAIPPNRYKVHLVWWKKHMRFVPEIQGVPGFTDIYIHSVGTVKDTMGCVGVGNNTAKGRLTNGPYWATVITQKIEEAIKDNEEIWVTFKE